VGFLRLGRGEKFILSAGEGSPAEGAKTRNESCGFFAFGAEREVYPDFTWRSPKNSYFVQKLLSIFPIN